MYWDVHSTIFSAVRRSLSLQHPLFGAEMQWLRNGGHRQVSVTEDINILGSQLEEFTAFYAVAPTVPGLIAVPLMGLGEIA